MCNELFLVLVLYFLIWWCFILIFIVKNIVNAFLFFFKYILLTNSISEYILLFVFSWFFFLLLKLQIHIYTPKGNSKKYWCVLLILFHVSILKMRVFVYHVSRWSVHSCWCIFIVLNIWIPLSHSFLFFFSQKSAFLVFSISLYLEIYLAFYDCNCSSLKLFFSLEVSLMYHMRANHRFILFWILLSLYLTSPLCNIL